MRQWIGNSGQWIRSLSTTHYSLVFLPAPSIVDIEFESGIGREDLGNFPQPFGHGNWRQQGVVALAQVVVVDVEIEREQVDGNRIGEAGGEIVVLEFLRVGTVCGGKLARLPGVERSFSAHTGFHLLPGQVSEMLRHTGAFDQGVPDVDVELEGHRKLVFHQAGGDEDALRISQVQVAMANRIVAEGNVVAVGNDGVVALSDRERYKVVRLAAEAAATGTGTAAIMR